MVEEPTLTNAFKEASRYWHLACNYDRVNPESSGVTFTAGNPHKGNYQKALKKIEEVVSL